MSELTKWPWDRILLVLLWCLINLPESKFAFALVVDHSGVAVVESIWELAFAYLDYVVLAFFNSVFYDSSNAAEVLLYISKTNIGSLIFDTLEGPQATVFLDMLMALCQQLPQTLHFLWIYEHIDITVDRIILISALLQNTLDDMILAICVVNVLFQVVSLRYLLAISPLLFHSVSKSGCSSLNRVKNGAAKDHVCKCIFHLFLEILILTEFRELGCELQRTYDSLFWMLQRK